MWTRYTNLPRAVHVLCLGTLINRAGTLVIPFLTIYLREEVHLDVEFATTAMGAFGLGAMIAALLGGHLADWLGRRVVMLLGMAGGAAILLLLSTLTSPGLILLGLAAFALVAEMYRPAASAMIADLTEPQSRPHAFGLMYLAINLGFTVAPVIAGLLLKIGFKWLFYCDALTSLVYAAILAAAVRETLPSKRAARPESADAPSAAEPPPQEHATVRLWDAARHILADWPFLTFCLASLLTAVVYVQAMSTFPLWLQQRGVGASAYGRIIAVNGLLIVCLQLPLTTIVSRFNRAAVMVAAAVFMAVGFGLIGLAATAWQFAGTVVIWTLGEMMQVPHMSAIVTDMAPIPLRARYMGVLSMTFSAAMLLGAPLGGRVLAHGGGAWLWAGAFITAMLAALSYLAISSRIASPSSR